MPRWDEWRNLADEARVNVLTDDDAGDNTLTVNDIVTYAAAGASGVINCYLPSVREVPVGATFTVVCTLATNNVVVKQAATNDAMIALSDQTITILNGYVIVQNAGGFWIVVDSVLA